MDTSSSAEGPETEAPPCSVCHGAGWVRHDVPVGHPDFGQAFPCDACRQRVSSEERERQLLAYSNLGPLVRFTFNGLVATGRSSDPSNQGLFRKAYETCKEYAAEPRGWLVLSGPTGCGKTHLAAAIANERLKQQAYVLYQHVPELLDALRASFQPATETAFDVLFEQVRSTPLLILDDLPAHSGTPWANEKLFQILNYRFNAQLPTVVTTALALPDLEERLQTRLTDPSLSRVLQVEKPGSGIAPGADALDLPMLAGMTFESFHVDRPGLDAAQQENLQRAYKQALDYAEQPDGWLVLMGDQGCGKTHLAAAIAHARRARGDEVRFVAVSDLLDFLRSAFAPDSKTPYHEAFEKVKAAPLLVLDDFGKHSSTPWANEKLFQIVSYRYNARLPTIITTSLTVDEMDSHIRSRIADVRVSSVFQITAPDYRSQGNTGQTLRGRDADAQSRRQPGPRRRA